MIIDLFSKCDNYPQFGLESILQLYALLTSLNILIVNYTETCPHFNVIKLRF